MAFCLTTNFSILPSQEHSPWLLLWVIPLLCALLEDAGNHVLLIETLIQSNLHPNVYLYLCDLLAD